MKKNSPMILIRWKKSQHSGHHGGSWKIAYADFMTAMMAFFLVMWLLSTSTPQQREQIADYFRIPMKDSVQNSSKSSISPIPMPKQGGDNIDNKTNNIKNRERELNHQKDIRRLNKTRYNLQQMLRNNPRLRDFQSNMKITLVHEGLRIEIIDSKKRPMFTTGGKEIAPYMRYIMRILAPVLNELPNRISLAGHTDNQPYINGERGYSNWELSADRANASRRELIEGGLMNDKILRVIGMANTMSDVNKHHHHASQRRISIIILTKQQEEAIKKENSESHSEFIENNEDPASQLWKLAAPQAFTGKNDFQLKSNNQNFIKEKQIIKN